MTLFILTTIQIAKSQNVDKDLIGDWWTKDNCGECKIELKLPYQEISFTDSLVVFYSLCNPAATGQFAIESSDNNSYTIKYQGQDFVTKFEKKDNSTLLLTATCLTTNTKFTWILKRIDKKEYTLSDYLRDMDLNKYIRHAQKRFDNIMIDK
jgi:hypothetical protein